MNSADVAIERESEERAFLQFASAVLTRAAVWSQTEGIPTTSYRKTTFVDTSWTHNVVTAPEYGILFWQHREEIVQLPETQECVHKLWDAGVLTYLLPREQRTISTDELTPEQVMRLGAHIVETVIHVAQRFNTVKLSSSQLLESYSHFRERWMATGVLHSAIVPVLNFTTDAPMPMKLSPNYELTRFSNDEKGWVWDAMTTVDERTIIPIHTFINTKFKLIGKRWVPTIDRAMDSQRAAKQVARSDQDMLYELRDIVTALRLTKAGDVAITSYVEQHDVVPPSQRFPTIGIPGVVLSDFQVRRYGSICTISHEDVAKVYSLVVALQQLDRRKHRGGLEVALRRFNQSYSREYYEDRLIDLAVALESTLLSDTNEAAELKYRLTLHGAALLASERDPEETRKFLKAMYDVRSRIVHSGKSLSEFKNDELLGFEWRAFAQACEDMARSILATYVQGLSKDHKSTVRTITEELEKRILRGLKSTRS